MKRLILLYPVALRIYAGKAALPDKVPIPGIIPLMNLININTHNSC